MSEQGEKYICLNCLNIDVLNEHLHCTKCNSDSVAKCDALVSRMNDAHLFEHKTVDRPIYRLYEVTCGPFRCTPMAESKDEAIKKAITEGQWHVDTLPSDIDVQHELLYGIPLVVSEIQRRSIV